MSRQSTAQDQRFRRFYLPAGIVALSLIGAAGAADGQIAFDDVSKEAGIEYRGNSYGSSWGDINGDSRPDIFAGNHNSDATLYLNRGDGTFDEIAAGTLDKLRGDWHGAAWADYDNDGDQDLFVSVGGRRGRGAAGEGTDNRLFENKDGRLVDRAGELGLQDSAGRGRTPFWIDLDGDGRLDIILVQLFKEDTGDIVFLNERAAFRSCPNGFLKMPPGGGRHRFGQRVRVFENDDEYLIFHRATDLGALYRLTGECRLESAVDDFLEGAGGAQDSVVADVNGDLRSDIVIVRSGGGPEVNTYSTSLLVAIKKQSARENYVEFTATGPIEIELSPHVYWPTTSIHIGAEGRSPDAWKFVLDPRDLRNNDLPDPVADEPDIRIGHLGDRDMWRIVVGKERRGVLHVVVRNEGGVRLHAQNIRPRRPAARPDTLLIQSKGEFIDASEQYGLTAPTRCRSVVAADFDNDMDLDLYLVCSAGTHNLPNVVLENVGGRRFVDVSDKSGATGSRDGIGDRASVGDYDDDGFLDIFVTNGAEPPLFPRGPHQLFRNRGNLNNWLKVDLRGTRSGRDAYGARVYLIAGDVTQLRVKDGGIRDRVQDHQVLHFGLAGHDRVDGLIVQWPTGDLETFAVDKVNRTVVAEEGAGRPSSTGQGLLLLAGRTTLQAGEKIPVVALFDVRVDPLSLRWRIDGRGMCAGDSICWHDFRRAGDSRIRVSGRLKTGASVTANLTLRVVRQ